MSGAHMFATILCTFFTLAGCAWMFDVMTSRNADAADGIMVVLALGAAIFITLCVGGIVP